MTIPEAIKINGKATRSVWRPWEYIYLAGWTFRDQNERVFSFDKAPRDVLAEDWEAWVEK